jgi:hypothetical protein
MLYEHVASGIAVEEFMQNKTALTNSIAPTKRQRQESALAFGF